MIGWKTIATGLNQDIPKWDIESPPGGPTQILIIFNITLKYEHLKARNIISNGVFFSFKIISLLHSA